MTVEFLGCWDIKRPFQATPPVSRPLPSRLPNDGPIAINVAEKWDSDCGRDVCFLIV